VDCGGHQGVSMGLEYLRQKESRLEHLLSITFQKIRPLLELFSAVVEVLLSTRVSDKIPPLLQRTSSVSLVGNLGSPLLGFYRATLQWSP